MAVSIELKEDAEYFGEYRFGPKWLDYPDARTPSRFLTTWFTRSSTSPGLDTGDLQLCAQAMCLEEMLDVEIPKGGVWYSGPRRRFTVDFTERLRDTVLAAVADVRAMIVSGTLPEALNDERCRECQLRNHCLPELVNAPRKIRRYMDRVVFECAT